MKHKILKTFFILFIFCSKLAYSNPTFQKYAVNLNRPVGIPWNLVLDLRNDSSYAIYFYISGIDYSNWDLLSVGKYCQVHDSLLLQDSLNGKIVYILKRLGNDIITLKGNKFFDNRTILKLQSGDYLFDIRSFYSYINFCEIAPNTNFNLYDNKLRSKVYESTRGTQCILNKSRLKITFRGIIVYSGKYQLLGNYIEFFDDNLKVNLKILIDSEGNLQPYRFCFFSRTCLYKPIEKHN